MIGGEDDDDDVDPYRRVVDATPEDVRHAVDHDDRELMESFWKRGDLEEIAVSGARKTLATPAAAVLVTELAARLQAALQSEGSSLAPLSEH